MKRFISLLAVAAAITLASCGTTGDDAYRIVSATQNIVVSQVATNGWFEMNQANSDVAFVSGPAPTPLGLGSAQFSTGPSALVAPFGGKPVLSTEQFDGQLLSDLDALGYWTYQSQVAPTHPHLAVAIKLQVDLDGDGLRDRTLVFEPGEQVGGTGAVLQNTWQYWDAFSGRWWNTGAPLFPTFHFTLADVIQAYPNAKIVNWHNALEGAGFNLAAGQNSGGFWSDFIGNADALEVGFAGNSTTFDFEFTTKNSCKKGGWTALGYRNQGDCVSAHVSKKK